MEWVIRPAEWATFAGVACWQKPQEFILWEEILNRGNYQQIIELGTAHGGFALYLGAQARARGMRFHTFDVEPPHANVPGFRRLDVHADQEIVALLFDRPTVLLCDTDDKRLDVALYAPLIDGDSLLVVHDWETMIGPEDIPPELVMRNREICEQLDSMSRCFVRRDG